MTVVATPGGNFDFNIVPGVLEYLFKLHGPLWIKSVMKKLRYDYCKVYNGDMGTVQCDEQACKL